jgi:two-component system, OmpR family, phosphate regulon response regulator PhoB
LTGSNYPCSQDISTKLANPVHTALRRSAKAIMKKILLVEDSKFLRMATERALITAGYEVISAGDGERALVLAREHAPSLVLLDVMLPKMSGLDVVKALKKDPTTASIPVMMLTGLSQKNATQMEKDGASSFFEKSDSMLGKGPDSLVASVDRILKK